MGKHLPEVLIQTKQQRSEVCAEKKNKLCKYFLIQTTQMRLIRNLLHSFLVPSLLLTNFSFHELADYVYLLVLTYDFVFCFYSSSFLFKIIKKIYLSLYKSVNIHLS